MAEQGFQADVDALRAPHEHFAVLAERVQQAHARLRAALDATEHCWGSDAAGQNFARGHVEAAESTAQELGALPGKLGDVGRRFTETADAYQQADAGRQFAADGFGRGED